MLLEHAATAAVHQRMVIAGRNDPGVSATILTTPRTKTAWGKRFEEARALGHALLDPRRGGAFGARVEPIDDGLSVANVDALDDDACGPVRSIQTPLLVDDPALPDAGNGARH